MGFLQIVCIRFCLCLFHVSLSPKPEISSLGALSLLHAFGKLWSSLYLIRLPFLPFTLTFSFSIFLLIAAI